MCQEHAASRGEERLEVLNVDGAEQRRGEGGGAEMYRRKKREKKEVRAAMMDSIETVKKRRSRAEDDNWIRTSQGQMERQSKGN